MWKGVVYLFIFFLGNYCGYKLMSELILPIGNVTKKKSRF